MLKQLYSSLSFWEAFARGCNWLLLACLPFLISAETYGTVVILSSYLLLISNIGVVGQNKVILRFVNSNTKSYIPYNIVISAFGTMVIFLIVYYFFNITSDYLLQLLIATLLFSNYTLYIAYGRKIFSRHHYAIVRVAYSLSRLFIGTILLILYENPVYYLYAEIVSLCVGLMIIRSDIWKVFTSKLNFKSTVCEKSISFGLPLTIHALAVFGIAFSDRLILAHFLSSDAVARYAALYTYAASLSFVYAVLAVTWEPRIYQAETLRHAEESSNRFLMKCLGIGVIFGVLSFLFYFFVFIELNEAYEGTIMPFLWVLSGHLVMPFYFKMNYLLAKIEKTNLISLSSIIAAIVNISLNIYLIPLLGIEGAAITTFLSYCVLFSISTIFYIKTKGTYYLN